MFTIPSWRDVLEDPTDVFPQAEIDPVDISALLLGIGGEGVLSGCAVTQALPTGMLVDVASGQVALGGEVVDVSAQPDVALDAADLSQPRHDLIVVDNTGVVSAVTGDPFDQSPPMPDIPGGTVTLASVYVPASLSNVLDTHITPKDVPVPVPRADLPGWEVLTAGSDVDLLNDATLNADADLNFTMAANTRYRVRARMFFAIAVGGFQTGGCKVGFNGPAAPTRVLMTIERHSINVSNLSQAGSAQYQTYSAYDPTTGLTVGSSAANNTAWAAFDGFVHNGANAGDFALLWAQNIVHLTAAVTRLRGSYLEFQEA